MEPTDPVAEGWRWCVSHARARLALSEPTPAIEQTRGGAGIDRVRGPLDALGQCGHATGDEEVTVWDRPATMKLWAPDYDGGNKAWIVFGDSGEEAIVGGSQVVRG